MWDIVVFICSWEVNLAVCFWTYLIICMLLTWPLITKKLILLGVEIVRGHYVFRISVQSNLMNLVSHKRKFFHIWQKRPSCLKDKTSKICWSMVTVTSCRPHSLHHARQGQAMWTVHVSCTVSWTDHPSSFGPLLCRDMTETVDWPCASMRLL